MLLYWISTLVWCGHRHEAAGKLNKLYLGQIDRGKKKRFVCLFNHLVISAIINIAATGREWLLLVIRKPTVKSYFTFSDTPCGHSNFPWTSSLCFFCFSFDSLLETSVWSWAQFPFILLVAASPRLAAAAKSCLLAIGHLQEHSEPHNSTLHNGPCYVNYVEPLPAAQPWWIMHEVIRIPVRWSDTWSWTSHRCSTLYQHSRDASCPIKILGQSFFVNVVIFLNEMI